MPATDPDSSIRVELAVERRDAAATRGLATWLASTAPPRVTGVVTIAVVSDARMRTLNRTFRGVDRATDVLSFPSAADPASARRRGSASEGRPGAAGPSVLGDIAIARGVAARQARDAGHTLSIEIRVLALHGLLHLLGYDHEHDAGQMARVEARLRRRGGLPGGLIERARAARPRRRLSS